MDTKGPVVAVGTVSKILAPGLRIGWAISDPEIVRWMALQKADGGSRPFPITVFPGIVTYLPGVVSFRG